jgi:glycerol-3-phosphate dehydrogenase
VRPNPSDIESQHFDVVIIGAGINGAGIARDAAMRGLKVLLLDKGDIASGTSGWSTRLIHGGLRYLEHGEIGLVRESLRERERLLRIAPHLVKPLPLLIPIYEQGKRGRLTIKAGMVAYDLLSLDKTLERHHMLSPDETLARACGLNPEGLRGAALYFDAQAEYAERLVVENALSAHEHGALILTYARADNLIAEDGKIGGVVFTDLLNNGSHIARASLVVNASGPWLDRILENSNPQPERMVCGTKGSHLIVGKFRDAPATALYVEAKEDGRPFFIIPWNNAYLIGTTDLVYDGDLDAVEASEAEIDYLLRETNRVIPAAGLSRDSIQYTYAGIRPLPCRRGDEPAGITRRHFIRDHAHVHEGLFSIIGGKLTTYRNLSEEMVDLLFKHLGRTSPRCRTARAKLPGAQVEDLAAFNKQFMAESPLPEAAAARLLKVYGTRARDVLELAGEADGLRKPFDDETGAVAAEILFSFRAEFAETLTDCLMRRNLVGLNSTAGLAALESALAIARQFLGWDEARAIRERDEYRKYVRRFHPRVKDCE